MCVNNAIDCDDDDDDDDDGDDDDDDDVDGDDDDGDDGDGVAAFVELFCSVLGIYTRESFLLIKRMKRWFERVDGDHGDKARNGDDEKEEEEAAVEMGVFAVVVLFA